MPLEKLCEALNLTDLDALYALEDEIVAEIADYKESLKDTQELVKLVEKQLNGSRETIYSLQGVIDAVDRVLWDSGSIHASRALAIKGAFAKFKEMRLNARSVMRIGPPGKHSNAYHDGWDTAMKVAISMIDCSDQVPHTWEVLEEGKKICRYCGVTTKRQEMPK